MSGSWPTYKTEVQKDGRGLFVIYRGEGRKLMARAPLVRGKVQTILSEGDVIRTTLTSLEIKEAVRVRSEKITHKTSLRKHKKDGAYTRSPFEQWRVVKIMPSAYAIKYDKARKIALANAKKLLREEDFEILGLNDD